MTEKARELLERAIEEWDSDRNLYEFHKVMEEIRAYLAEPEVKREPVFDAMKKECPYTGDLLRGAFYDGWIKAEKHHGIGGGDE